MKCINCGANLNDDDKFCPVCGAEVSKSSPFTPPINEANQIDPFAANSIGGEDVEQSDPFGSSVSNENINPFEGPKDPFETSNNINEPISNPDPFASSVNNASEPNLQQETFIPPVNNNVEQQNPFAQTTPEVNNTQNNFSYENPVNSQPVTDTSTPNSGYTATNLNQNAQYGQYNNSNNNNNNNGKNKSKKSNTVLILIIVVIVLAILITGIFFLVKGLMKKDNGNNNASTADTNNSTSNANITEVAETETSTSKVKCKGYTFSIPDNYIYEYSSSAGALSIIDEDETWSSQIAIIPTSFNTLNRRREEVLEEISESMSGLIEYDNFREKEVGEKNYVLVDLNSTTDEGSMLAAFTELDSTHSLFILFISEDLTINEDLIDEINPIVESAEKGTTSSSKGLETNEESQNLIESMQKATEKLEGTASDTTATNSTNVTTTNATATN